MQAFESEPYVMKKASGQARGLVLTYPCLCHRCGVESLLINGFGRKELVVLVP